MKLLVIIEPKFQARSVIFTKLMELKDSIDSIVLSKNSGNEALVNSIAQELNITVVIVAPEWHLYKNKAMSVRNEKMAAECDKAIVFTDIGHLQQEFTVIETFRKLNKPVEIILS